MLEKSRWNDDTERTGTAALPDELDVELELGEPEHPARTRVAPAKTAAMPTLFLNCKGLLLTIDAIAGLRQADREASRPRGVPVSWELTRATVGTNA